MYTVRVFTLSNVFSQLPSFLECPLPTPPLSPSSLLTCAASDAEEFRQLKALYLKTQDAITTSSQHVKAQKAHARTHGLMAT